MEKNRTFLWIVILLLGAVALALAYGVYNREAPVGGPNVPVQSGNGEPTTQTPTPGGGLRVFTEAETRLLAGVPEGASETERQAYTDSARAIAKDAAEVGIVQCAGNPLVSTASKEKGEVTFRNEDGSEHLLAFNNGKEKFTIAAKETKKIRPAFSNGLGFYTYTCDNQTAGILIVGE
jgi:hypothetical protein